MFAKLASLSILALALATSAAPWAYSSHSDITMPTTVPGSPESYLTVNTTVILTPGVHANPDTFSMIFDIGVTETPSGPSLKVAASECAVGTAATGPWEDASGSADPSPGDVCRAGVEACAAVVSVVVEHINTALGLAGGMLPMGGLLGGPEGDVIPTGSEILEDGLFAITEV